MSTMLAKISRIFFLGSILVVVVCVALVQVTWVRSRDLKENKNNFQVNEIKGSVLGTAKSIDTTNAEVVISQTVLASDARPLIIKRYLEKYKSPLAPYSDLIFQLSVDNGFDYYWIVAIAQQESNLCKKIPEDSHNCWGYGIHKNGTLKFESYELALKSYAQYLKREYFDKGLNTPELIMKKYCPHSNGSWAYGVNQFINDLETGDF